MASRKFTGSFTFLPSIRKSGNMSDLLLSLTSLAISLIFRTEFNQADYDEEDNNNRKEAQFLDKIRDFEKACTGELI